MTSFTWGGPPGPRNFRALRYSKKRLWEWHFKCKHTLNDVSLVSDRRNHCLNCKRHKAENQGEAEICVAKSNENAQLRTDQTIFSLNVRWWLKSSNITLTHKGVQTLTHCWSGITQWPQMTSGFPACVYMQTVDVEWDVVMFVFQSLASLILSQEGG